MAAGSSQTSGEYNKYIAKFFALFSLKATKFSEIMCLKYKPISRVRYFELRTEVFVFHGKWGGVGHCEVATLTSSRKKNYSFLIYKPFL